MATVVRRGGSKIWTAFFRDHTGRQYCLSTKETDKRLALVVAHEWEKSAWKMRSKVQTQRVIDRLHEMINGERIARHSLREYATSWLKGKKHETQASTMDFYQKSVLDFLSFFKVRCDLPITEILREDVLSYREHLAGTVSSKTVNHHLKCLKMVLKAARRDGLIADDPSEFISGVKREVGTPKRPFTRDEISKVLAVCDKEWRSMILFALYTGQRLGDIANLHWSAVDRRRGEIRITTGKTQKMLIHRIGQHLRKHVDSLEVPADLGPVHPRAYRIAQKNKRTALLSNQFGDILARAGLRPYQPHNVSQGKGRNGRRTGNALTFHSLRHTCTSWLHEAGVPRSVAMEFVGHVSSAIHQHYTTVGDESMQRAADSFPDVTGLPDIYAVR